MLQMTTNGVHSIWLSFMEEQKTGKVSFKAYRQGQALLFPPNLYELIADDHLVRAGLSGSKIA